MPAQNPSTHLKNNKGTPFNTLIATGFLLAFALTLQPTTYAADTTPPITIYTQTPATPDGNNGWYKSIIRFDLQATDLDSGVKDINYRVDNGVWKKFTFTDALNLAPNPSFENTDSSWQGDFEYDGTTSEPSFPHTSAKITSTELGWKSINHKDNFAVAAPYSNMTASVFLKTQDVTDSTLFKIYSVSQDENEQYIYSEITSSPSINSTTDWTKVYVNFSVTDPNALGVYMEIGLNGTGTVWADAVSLTASATSATGSFTVATDSSNHIVNFYSTDYAGNQETIHTVTFKQDMTPPTNWHDSGAFRGILGPSNHHLYVYTNVEDETSGISTFTDKYQYHTDKNPGFGTFSNLMSCSSSWQPDDWSILISPPFFPGVKSAYLLTPKTDFCNSDWKICKTVRFYAMDMAGNYSIKDMCINGPWIRLRGGGDVRSNYFIDMLSEADDDNTDSLIETTGNTINFFSSSKNWKAKNSPTPAIRTYEDYETMSPDPSSITSLATTSGRYAFSGSTTLTKHNIPSGFDSTTFDQVIFVPGDLTIEDNITISDQSTALFIVEGDVKVAKSVEELEVAIVCDGTFYSAYDITEGESSKTLNLNGIYHANKFTFQRTLQGTNNSNTPSENFIYEPKYLVQLRGLFGDSGVKWLSVE